MTDLFIERLENRFPDYLETLGECRGISRENLGEWGRMIGSATPGVYAFYEEGSPMYVGRSDDIKKRVQIHGRPKSKLGQAAFAATIARMQATISYRIGRPDTGGLRQQDLHKRVLKARRECARFRAEYDAYFDKAKARVSQMCVHFVNIPDSIEQTIFEVYAHVKLGTPYNYDNFLNH